MIETFKKFRAFSLQVSCVSNHFLLALFVTALEPTVDAKLEISNFEHLELIIHIMQISVSRVFHDT